MTIYLSNRQVPATLSNNNPSFQQNLDGWQARSVRVDNYGLQYVFLPEIGLYVDPGVRSAIYPLPGSAQLNALFKTPPGVVLPPSPSSTDTARLLFTEQEQQSSPGFIPAAQSLSGTNTPIGSSSVISLVQNTDFPAAFQRRVFDWFQDGTFSGAAATPVISQANPGGRLLVCTYWKATILGLAGGGATPQIQLTDGITVIDRAWMSALAAGAGASDRIIETPVGYSPTLNHTLSLQWDRVIPANTVATLEMGGYFSG